jgi:hypothetical protein
LADLWVTASSARRAELTRASHQIDQTLRRDADTAGESRAGRWRVLLVEPIGVAYRVDPDGQTVTVSRVWTF